MNLDKTTYMVLRLFVLSAACITLQPPAMGQSGLAQRVSVPSVPPELAVPVGNQAFLKAEAAGTQNYICMPSGWTFIGPQATLFVTIRWVNGPIRQQIGTHFLSPNPAEADTPRPFWQSSIDSSLVAGVVIANSSDPRYVDSTAIPWLLLRSAGTQNGPTGGSAFSQTTFIQRVNTSGGLMPATACTTGSRAFVPYTADYVFYKKSAE